MCMNVKEAISFISMYSPCPHDCLSKPLNFVDSDSSRQTWATCEDCGQVLLLSNLEKYRESSRKFQEAIDTLLKADPNGDK